MSGVGRPTTASCDHVSQPRRIRFVPNDGQPHTKRRRITAAYVRANLQCPRRTNVNYIRDSDCSCIDVRHVESGRQGVPAKVPVCMERVFARLPAPLMLSVCKTCSDNGHTCLGYAESSQPPNGASLESKLSREDGDGPSSPTRSTSNSPDGRCKLSPDSVSEGPLQGMELAQSNRQLHRYQTRLTVGI